MANTPSKSRKKQRQEAKKRRLSHAADVLKITKLQETGGVRDAIAIARYNSEEQSNRSLQRQVYQKLEQTKHQQAEDVIMEETPRKEAKEPPPLYWA